MLKVPQQAVANPEEAEKQAREVMGWVLIGICTFSIVVSMAGMFHGVFKLLKTKFNDYMERRQKAKI